MRLKAFLTSVLILSTAPLLSRCAEGDAYWADVVHVETDESGGPKMVIAVITDDRYDGPL